MAGFDGVDAEFARRMRSMMADAPGGVGIVSGYRSVSEQQVLYNKYLNGTGNLAAPPGKSNHNHGTAMDISFASPEVQSWVHANAGRYGLGFTVPGEPWHIEPIGGSGVGVYVEADVPSAGYSSIPSEMSEGDITARILEAMGATPDEASVGVPGGGATRVGTRAQGGLPSPGIPPEEYSSGAGGVDGIVQAARAAGFQGEELRTMVAIAIGESGGNAGAINDTGLDRSVGLWQINQLAHGDSLGTREQLMNPLVNAKAARTLQQQSGFKPWTVYTSGKYLQHLAEADRAIGG